VSCAKRLNRSRCRLGLRFGWSQRNMYEVGVRIAARGRFSGIRQVAPVCTPPNTCFIGLTGVHDPNGISILSAVFAGFSSVTYLQTDHATLTVTIGRIYVRSTAMRRNNNPGDLLLLSADLADNSTQLSRDPKSAGVESRRRHCSR